MSNVAIVIPAYNCESYVEATLRSLLDQGDSLNSVDRVILSDDCSQDRTIELARATWAVPTTFEILAASHNRGEYQNVNEAVSRLPAYIEWVLILHADDMANPGWLSTLLHRISAADEKIGSICTSWDNLYEDGHVTPGENRLPPTPERILGNSESVVGTLLRGCWWHISGCAIRVDLYRRIGGLPITLKNRGDWDFLLRVLESGWDVEYIPKALITYRAHPASKSAQLFPTHTDVFVALTVMRRHRTALDARSLVAFHWRQLKMLGKRFASSVVKAEPQRAFATLPMAYLTLCCLGKCLGEHLLGMIETSSP